MCVKHPIYLPLQFAVCLLYFLIQADNDLNKKKLWLTGMIMAVALQAERGVIEKKKPDIKQRRIVVTGMGVVTPLGHDPDMFYNNLLDGVSGISEIERFDCSNFPTVI
jgi:3-oxoacyl-[acyl-carrier-protein] synthase II